MSSTQPRSQRIPLLGTFEFRRAFVTILALYPLVLLVATAIIMVAPQRRGPLALFTIFAPYLFAAVVALVPFVFDRMAMLLRWAMLGCALVAAVWFGPSYVSRAPLETPDALRFEAMTWNLYIDNLDTSSTITALRNGPSIVALQELSGEQAAAIGNDSALRERYPFQWLEPGGADGIGLLSIFPITEQQLLTHPEYPGGMPTQYARLDLGDGVAINVVNAHPRTGRSYFLQRLPLPYDFDPTVRDEEIRYIRGFVDQLLARNERVLLLGDFNTTEREPAYDEFTRGLLDVHAYVGAGSGQSWRLSQFRDQPWAMLRIDYLLSSPGVTPLRVATDCTPRGSDHCSVRATFELPDVPNGN